MTKKKNNKKNNNYKQGKNKYAQFTEPQAILDYHNKGIINEFEIEEILNSFLNQSKNNNLNKLLIITGKGLHSKSGPIIRPLIERLLKKHSLVNSFNTARIDRGGAGAFEVNIN